MQKIHLSLKSGSFFNSIWLFETSTVFYTPSNICWAKKQAEEEEMHFCLLFFSLFFPQIFPTRPEDGAAGVGVDWNSYGRSWGQTSRTNNEDDDDDDDDDDENDGDDDKKQHSPGLRADKWARGDSYGRNYIICGKTYPKNGQERQRTY